MARRRRIRWPAFAVILLFTAAAVFVLLRPSILTPAVTHLINRQLQTTLGGTLRVGSYHLRPLVGLDVTDVTLILPGDRGGLTQVAVDTLELDFRLREILGREARLRRLWASGVTVYRMADEPLEETRERTFAPPRLRIDDGNIRTVTVETSDHQGRSEERIARLNWRGELHSDGERVRVKIRSGDLVWPTRSTVLERLYGDVVLDAKGARTTGLAGRWNDGEVQVAGFIGDGVVELDASGRGVTAVAVTDLTGLELGFAAHGDIDLQVAAVNDTVRLRADFSGRLEDWDLHEVHGEAVITPAGADFHRLAGGVADAHYDGTLFVDPDGVVTLEGEARGLDLRRGGLIPDTDPVDLPRTAGHGRLRIVHTPDDVATHVTGTLYAGEVEIMPFDTCQVDVWAVADSLRFRVIDLHRGSIRATLVGSSDRDEVFRGELQLQIGDLRDIPAHWEWPPLAGRARGQASIAGPLTALAVKGEVSFQDLNLGPLRAESGDAHVEGVRVLGEDWGVRTVTVGDGFQLGGIPLGTYHLGLRGDATSAAVDSFRSELGDTVLTVCGRADFAAQRALLGIDRGSVNLEGNRWRLVGDTAAALGSGFVRVPRLRLISDQGEMAADLEYCAADSLLRGSLEARNLDLNLLDPFLRERFRPGGQVTASISVDGTPQRPRMRAQGRLLGAGFPAARIDTLDLAARFSGGQVMIDTLGLVTDWGRVGARGTISQADTVSVGDYWPGAVLDLDMTVRDGRWEFLQQFEIEALERISGGVNGSLHVGGTTADPLVLGELDSAPFTFQWLKLDRLQGTLRVDQAQLALGHLVGNQDQLSLNGRVELPLRFDLLSAPTSPPDGPFLVQIKVDEDSDLGPLLHATSAFTRVEGRGGGELIVSGPMSRPGYQGRMRLHDVGFVLRGNQEVFRNCEAIGSFHDDRLELERITGEEGLRGTFSGQGHLLFDGLVLRTWDIDFEADRFLVASIPDLRAVIQTGNGRFTGVPVGPERVLVPRFEGDYALLKGRYTGTFAEPGGAAADPTLGNVAPDWLADLRITGPPRSARIVNDTMELELSGDVTLVRDADGMILNGGMTVDNGRLPVFHNTFRVVRGRLDFSRQVGVVPDVDIDAETRVRVRNQAAGQGRVERLLVHAVGPADAMTISYSSESGYPREAIERMLLGLSPYPDEQGDQGALANASIGAGFNFIEREIAREIPLFDTVEIDQISRQQQGVGLDPLVGVGKYLFTDFYVKYAQGINQNDHEVLVEYQISDSLLLQGESRRRIDEYQGEPTYNLDLKYRYEY